jgi:hypothetical protein
VALYVGSGSTSLDAHHIFLEVRVAHMSGGGGARVGTGACGRHNGQAGSAPCHTQTAGGTWAVNKA